MSVAVEIDGTHTRFKRFDGERRLLKDLSYGGAVGLERRLGPSDLAVAVGGARIAPLAPAPILQVDLGGTLGDRAGWSLHAGRTVRNRTLPRLPTDGEAWVRQGIGLAQEDPDEAPESSTRAGGAIRTDVGRQRFVLGIEGCLRERGLALDEAQIDLLAIDRQSEIPEGAMRGSRRFASPTCEIFLVFPGSFRLRVAGWTNIAEGGWRSHMALPAAEGNGEACWTGALFKGDLDLDLSLAWRFRDRIATPYGILAPGARADGRILGRIGPAEIFFVLANITDAVATSLSYDGRFMFMPRRHYSAGVTWHFID